MSRHIYMPRQVEVAQYDPGNDINEQEFGNPFGAGAGQIVGDGDFKWRQTFSLPNRTQEERDQLAAFVFGCRGAWGEFLVPSTRGPRLTTPTTEFETNMLASGYAELADALLSDWAVSGDTTLERFGALWKTTANSAAATVRMSQQVQLQGTDYVVAGYFMRGNVDGVVRAGVTLGAGDKINQVLTESGYFSFRLAGAGDLTSFEFGLDGTPADGAFGYFAGLHVVRAGRATFSDGDTLTMTMAGPNPTTYPIGAMLQIHEGASSFPLAPSLHMVLGGSTTNAAMEVTLKVVPGVPTLLSNATATVFRPSAMMRMDQLGGQSFTDQPVFSGFTIGAVEI